MLDIFVQILCFYLNIKVWTYIYQNQVQYKDIVSVIEGVLNFTYLENTGIAFGIFSDFDGLKVVFIVVPILITLYLFSLLNNKEFQNPFSHISLLLIISGAIGNIIDRIFRGYVIDFIQFDIDIFPYIFNIADSSVTIGLLLLLYSSIIVQRR